MNQFLTTCDAISYEACIAALLISLMVGDRKWALFCLLTCLSFTIAIALDSFVKSIDPNKVWRYLFWIMNDLAWFLFSVRYWNKKKIYSHQALIAGFITFALVSLNTFRFIDRHFFELEYSIGIYKQSYPAITLLVVLLCWLPAVTKLRSR